MKINILSAPKVHEVKKYKQVNSETNCQIASDASDIDLGSTLITNKENLEEYENVLRMKVTAKHS